MKYDYVTTFIANERNGLKGTLTVFRATLDNGAYKYKIVEVPHNKNGMVITDFMELSGSDENNLWTIYKGYGGK